MGTLNLTQGAYSTATNLAPSGVSAGGDADVAFDALIFKPVSAAASGGVCWTS